MPSRRSTSPSASPSGCGLAREHVSAALDEHDLAAEATDRLRHLDADRPAAEHQQPARHRLHARSPRGSSRSPRARAGPGWAGPPDRRRSRGRRGRRCGGRRPPRRLPVPASRPRAADQVDAVVGEPALLAGVGVVRDHEVAPRERRLDVDLSRARRLVAACAASPGRSSVLDGMQAQYEHSPPTSSRSTSATRRPPSASAPAQCSPGEPPPITMTS